MSMRAQIAAIAGPMNWTDNRKSWIARVPEKVEGLTGTRISLRIIRGLWHGELDDNHWAALEIRNAVELIEIQRKIARLTEQYEKIARGILVIDTDKYRTVAGQYINLVHELRAEVSARTKRKVKSTDGDAF